MADTGMREPATFQDVIHYYEYPIRCVRLAGGRWMVKSVLENALFAAIAGAVVGSVCSFFVSRTVAPSTIRETIRIERDERLSEQAHRALIFSNDLVRWMKASLESDVMETERRAASISAHIGYFDAPEFVSMPAYPGLDAGASATAYANRVTGRLQAINRRAAAAFLLGWNAWTAIGKGDMTAELETKVDAYASDDGFD